MSVQFLNIIQKVKSLCNFLVNKFLSTSILNCLAGLFITDDKLREICAQKLSAQLQCEVSA